MKKKPEVNKKSTGFTDAEREAMKSRARELAAEASGQSGEKAVLAKIAEMPEPDRGMAKRIHEIVTANAPALSPKTWYGMPAYARDGKVVCFSRPRRNSRHGTPRSASTTPHAWTTATCGQPHSP